MKTDIVLAGVGGQGVLSIAAVIADAAMRAGLNLRQSEVHGMSRRGGEVHADLRLSDSPVFSDLIPLGTAEMILSSEPMEALRYLPYLSPEGRLITSSMPFRNIGNYPDERKLLDEILSCDRVIALDVGKLAKENGVTGGGNMILLGAAAVFLPIVGKAELLASIGHIFGGKGPAVVEKNRLAMEVGYGYALPLSGRL